MQLNSSALNVHSLNGLKRVPVYAAAQVISGFSAELAAVNIKHLDGAGVLALSGDMSPQVYRHLNDAVMLGITPSFLGGALRVSGGTSRISLLSSLFYSKTAYGEGAVNLDINFQAVVGVTFIEGAATLLPVEMAISANRLRHSAGDTNLFITGDLSASAYRMAEGITSSGIHYLSELDPAHITSEGVRYITPMLVAPFEIGLQDVGLRRQSYLGATLISLLAFGSSQRIRTANMEDCTSSLVLSADATVTRAMRGEILQRTVANLDGEVYVRGSGESKLVITSAGTGVAYRNSLKGNVTSTLNIEFGTFRTMQGTGGILLPLSISGTGTRKVNLSGRANLNLPVQAFTPVVLRRAQGDATQVLVGYLAGEVFVPFAGDTELRTIPALEGNVFRFGSGDSMPIPLILDGDLSVLALGEGKASITLFSSSEAYLNPAATDIEKQHFYRPKESRDFYRIKELRDFGR